MAVATLTAASGGEGLSIAEKMRELRRAFLNIVTPDDIRAIGRKLIEKACEGCKQCLKLVLGYFIGRPGPRPLGLTMEEPAPVAAPGSPDETPPAGYGAVTKPVQTADARPEPPALTPEMERFLSQPFSAAELDEARRTSLLNHRGKR